MSQIIITSRYLKSETETKRKNYTRYIATRETVEIREQNIIDREAPATEKQQELLSDLLKDFPEAKKYLEYDRIFACGGSWMVKGKLIAEGRFDEIEKLTREAAEIVKDIRG